MERQRLQQERKEFIAAFCVIFPHVSDTMAVKCWRATADMQPNYRTSLTRDLLRAAGHVANQHEIDRQRRKLKPNR